jgi:hypothetical protein
MLPAKVKDWMVSSEWENMDQAIYSVNKLKLLNGTYWFWLMADYSENDPKMLQVLISRSAISYTLNKKHVTCRQINDEQFKCYCGIWQYKDGKINDLVHDNCTCTVKPEDLSCVTESGYKISISHLFPYFHLEVLNGNGNKVITRFGSVSSSFNSGFIQNPLVSYSSRIAFSDQFDAYARNSRGFCYFIASKMSDLFGTCKGSLFEHEFNGSFWLERALGFGSTLPWKIVMVNFSDKSRLWYRYFPSKFFNYGSPLEFIFDDMVTRKRYTFSEMTFQYTGSNRPSTNKFGPEVDTIHLTGKGNQGETIQITANILDRHLYQYTVALIKFNYNQIVLNIEDINIQACGKDLLLGKRSTLSYGEDAYFSW